VRGWNLLKHRGVLVFAFAVFALAQAGEARAAEWVKYASTADGEFFYDKQSIRYFTPTVMRVWERTLFSKKAKDEIIAQFKDDIPKIVQLEYERSLIDFDCVNKKKRVYLFERKNKDDEDLHREFSMYYQWDAIPSGSASEKLFTIICVENK